MSYSTLLGTSTHFWKTISPLKTNWGIVLEIGNDRVSNVNMWVGSLTLVSYRRSSHDLQARSQDRDTPPSLESSSPHRPPCSLRSVLSLGLSRGRWAFFSSRSASMLLPFWSCGQCQLCAQARQVRAAPDQEEIFAAQHSQHSHREHSGLGTHSFLNYHAIAIFSVHVANTSVFTII